MKTVNVCLVGFVFVVCAWAEPLLEGRVRLESGEPVADAQVRLFDLTDLRQGAVARAQTDGTGYFALPLAALRGRALPEGFALGPNYPNPFNPSTIIPYQLAVSSQVRLEVFNLLGQRIATLVDGERPAGFHTATWYAVDGAGRAVGAGVYIYRMTVGEESQTGRMVLVDGQAGVSAAGAASVWSGVSGGGSDRAESEVYGLLVSGEGLAPYVDSSFRVEAGMAPVELVVSVGEHSVGKAADDDCAFCDLFDALNDDDEGPNPSGKVQATLDAPPAPTNLRFEAVTDSSCTVRWDAVEGATDYDVNYKPAVGGKWTNEPHRGTGLYNTINDLEPDTEYRWAVRAENGGGASEWVFGPNFTTLADETDETTEEEAADEQVTIPDAKLRAAIEKALGKARSAPITVADMKTLTRLEAEDAGISDLTGLEFATNLTWLLLWRNNITDISALSGLTNLTSLLLWRNNITDISALSGLTNLTWLDLNGNNITDADLLALSGLTNLTRLGLGYNNVSNVSALSGLTNLTSLYLPDNNITDADLLALSGFTNLTSLSLEFNNITDVSALSGLTNLTFLTLASNNITDVSALSGLTNLESLRLWNNNITDVSALSGLTNLQELVLAYNNITDVSALSGLTNLQELVLAYNNITDVSALSGLTNLQELYLQKNPLSFSSINDYIPALLGRGVTVEFDQNQLREGDFNIEFVFLNQFTGAQKNVLRYAARQWMSVIREDLPDYEFTQGWSGECGDQSFEIPAGERIDDLRVYVTSFDDSEGYVGWGGPHLLRETYLPVLGCMGFDLKRANLWNTGLHEMGHVLGFGSIWREFGYLQDLSWDDSNADTHFNGPRAIAAFNDAGGRNYTGAKVPIEKMDGTHWRYYVLEGELMVPGGGGALSAITVQSLADLGYGVDVTQADPFTLPDAASAKVSAKIAAAMPSALGVDGTLADAYTLPSVQGRIAGGLPLIPGDDRLRGRLESTEEIGPRGFDFRDGRLMGRLVPSPQAVPTLSCGAGLRQKPIHVVDPQGRIIRTLGD